MSHTTCMNDVMLYYCLIILDLVSNDSFSPRHLKFREPSATASIATSPESCTPTQAQDEDDNDENDENDGMLDLTCWS